MQGVRRADSVYLCSLVVGVIDAHQAVVQKADLVTTNSGEDSVQGSDRGDPIE